MPKITINLIKELRKLTGSGIIECKRALTETNGDINLAIDNLRKSGQLIANRKANHTTTEGIIITKTFNNEKSGAIIEINCESDFVAKDENFLKFGKEVLFSVIKNKNIDFNDLKNQFEKLRIILINKVGENINIRRIAILNGLQIGNYLHNNRIGVLVSTENASKESLKYIAMHIAASKPEYILQNNIPNEIIDREQKIQLEIAIKSGKNNKIAEKIVMGRMKKFFTDILLIEQPFIMDTNKTVGDFIKEKNIKITDFIRFELGENIQKK